MKDVVLIGYLGADAELKDFNGRKFISFRVADSERYTDASGNIHEEVTWNSCLMNVQGEPKLLPFLKKGTQVCVVGKEKIKKYNGKNGIDVAININVRDFQLLSSNKQPQPQQQNQPQPQPQRSPVYGGQQPQQTQAQVPQQQGGDPFSGNGGIDGYWGGLPY